MSLQENKLERMFLASLFSLVKYLWINSGAYPEGENLKGASLFVDPGSTH
jgi:hypothetical protein